MNTYKVITILRTGPFNVKANSLAEAIVEAKIALSNLSRSTGIWLDDTAIISIEGDNKRWSQDQGGIMEERKYGKTKYSVFEDSIAAIDLERFRIEELL